MQRALSVSRMTGNRSTFPQWYQAVVREADLAENSPVRGMMIIKPWGYGIWEEMQRDLDRRIKETGHDNAYFPLFIPLSLLRQGGRARRGLRQGDGGGHPPPAEESIDGKLEVDPEAKLEEPLIVRPTSETIIGDAFQRWIKSHRDLPLLINQWANVVRWEMRTRLFLRTSEFLWQEGHTAHADEADARAETMRMLEVYRAFSEETLAMPVIAGEKPENERFPGAVATYSIEAMMQDGKALQAGTSHYLGQNFARAQNIRFQSAAGELEYCHTTSWGVSTRLIGGVIMTHGDDDGLRLPPAIAPRQVVIVPILRDKPEDAEVLAYGEALAKALSGHDRARRARCARCWTSAASARPTSAGTGCAAARRSSSRSARATPPPARSPSCAATACGTARRSPRTAMPRDEFVAAVPALLAEIQASLFARGQGACSTPTSAATSRPSTSWPSISARRPTTRTRAAPSRAGCARPGRGRPARRWRRSTRG